MQVPSDNIVIRTQQDERNRALDMRRDNDTFTVPSITIYDIDYAIYYYLGQKIQPQVLKNGVITNVPVIFANGEKWVQIQRDGYIRDSNKKILVPLISIKRLDMAEDERFVKLGTGRLDRDNAILFFPVTQKNNQFDMPRANNQISHEYYVSPIPVHIRVNYELMVWADTVESLNKIVEAIIPHDSLPWGDGFQFVTKIQNYTFDISNNVGEDRAAKCTIPIVVDGILQNEFLLKESTVQKSYSIKRVVFTNEVAEDNIIVDYQPKSIKPSPERLSQKILHNKL